MIDNIGKKKVFIKMNLRWGYNNVGIKKGDKWKIAFSMPESIFKLMVMFIGLTNSLATFQVVMNNLLRDIIEAEDITISIDNVMVRTETEKEYDNTVEELLRRIAENDLFVKPEKYSMRG